MLFNNKLIESNKILLQRSDSDYINKIMLTKIVGRINSNYTYFIQKTHTHYIITIELINKIEEV